MEPQREKKEAKGGQEKLRLKRKHDLELVAGQGYSVQQMFNKILKCQSENMSNNDNVNQWENINKDIIIQEIENNRPISATKTDVDNIDNAQTDQNKFEKEKNKEILQEMEVSIPILEGNESNTFFIKPHYSNIDDFFKYHPKQPTKKTPFNTKIYNRKIDCQNRKWLTFCEENNKLYCLICLAYGRDSEDNVFIKGFNNWHYVHQYVERHEKSKFHDENAVRNFMRTKNCSSITTQLKSIRNEKIIFNRNVVKRIN
ncbi:zinc finger MYM-type protein 5-like [Centruroides vittatus]|uniref:zinc finger MYM-type protein 5-like n=1 Tax=Centruroides vittatus TaxID=120091 RepID=UPI003510888A